MKHYRPVKWILFGIFAAAGSALPAAVYLCSEDGALSLLCGAFSAFMLLLGLLLTLNSEYYIRQTAVRLSDLLSSITKLESLPDIPVDEDTLLSKLQNQTLRLTGILRSQQQKAAQKEQEIKSLVSDISHQLKTPAASLKMYGELLSDETISESERREYTRALMLSLKKLEFLMDSLIKMSRLESRIIQLKAEVLPIEDTVLEAVHQCWSSAKSKNIRITFASPDDPVLLSHDRRWLCEALFNILDNGIKYTPSGGQISVQIQRYEMFCRIDLADTGRGIPPEEEEKVFQRFYRGESSRGQEGLGLGLYLSRAIITGQGGYIKLKSQKQGSMFSVFLPLE